MPSSGCHRHLNLCVHISICRSTDMHLLNNNTSLKRRKQTLICPFLASYRVGLGYWTNLRKPDTSCMIVSKVWRLQRCVKEGKLYRIAIMYMNPSLKLLRNISVTHNQNCPTFPKILPLLPHPLLLPFFFIQWKAFTVEPGLSDWSPDFAVS